MKNYIDPNKSAVTLLTTFPVFILIILAAVLPKPQRATGEDLIDRHYLLETLVQALPVPRTMVQRLIVRWLIEWIDKQISIAATLHQANLQENFWLPN